MVDLMKMSLDGEEIIKIPMAGRETIIELTP